MRSINQAHVAASSSLKLLPGSYVYSVKPTSFDNQIAAICSDDSLRVADPSTLELSSSIKAHGGLTCLESNAGNDTSTVSLITAGRDGFVRAWDMRAASKKPILKLKDPAFEAPILSLSISPLAPLIATGTELAKSGPQGALQATVNIWDYRSPKAPICRYEECHNDDVTELSFHPSLKNCLLSGSTDGLVNIYDVSISEEDDALNQVMNHGSVHHAEFLDEDVVFALSHDEVFSIYHLTDPDSNSGRDPLSFGDLRTRLECDYVVDVLSTRGNKGAFVAAGSHATNRRIDLVPLNPSPDWTPQDSGIVRLEGAHGEDIVRSIYIDHQGLVLTGGEDGYVRIWRQNEEAESQSTGAPSKHRRGTAK